MRLAVGRANREQPERPVSLKIGVHNGAAIALTPNERPDHLGRTVNIAARVRAVVEAGEIRASQEVWCYPGARHGSCSRPTSRSGTVELR
jgi:class 3 adenylate cyclase